jgi:hypothetical protein
MAGWVADAVEMYFDGLAGASQLWHPLADAGPARLTGADA